MFGGNCQSPPCVCEGNNNNNARSSQFVCAKVLYESLLVPVRPYGSETMIWKEKERSSIRGVQMDNL